VPRHPRSPFLKGALTPLADGPFHSRPFAAGAKTPKQSCRARAAPAHDGPVKIVSFPTEPTTNANSTSGEGPRALFWEVPGFKRTAESCGRTVVRWEERGMGGIGDDLNRGIHRLIFETFYLVNFEIFHVARNAKCRRRGRKMGCCAPSPSATRQSAEPSPCTPSPDVSARPRQLFLRQKKTRKPPTAGRPDAMGQCRARAL
jgi:hypothetical protein